MTTEERIRLVLETAQQGDLAGAIAGLKELVKESKESARVAKEAKNDVYEWADSYDLVEQAQTSVTKSTGVLVTKTREATKAQSDLAAAKEATGNKAAQLAQAISRFGQDAAAGISAPGDAFHKLNMLISGTANNLDPLLGAAGLGGVAAILATIGYTMLPLVIRGLEALFRAGEDQTRQFGSRLEELKAKLQVLEEKEHKIDVDYSEIESAKREVDALSNATQVLNTLLGKQSKREKDSGQAFDAAIVDEEGGQAALKRALTQAGDEAVSTSARATGARTRVEEAREAQRQAEAMGPDSMGIRARAIDAANKEFIAASDALNDTISRVRTDAEDAFKSQLGIAREGKGTQQTTAQQNLRDRFRRVGANNVADAMERATPEFLSKQEEAEAVYERFLEQSKQKAEQAKLSEQEVDADLAEYEEHLKAFKARNERIRNAKAKKEAKDKKQADKEEKAIEAEAALLGGQGTIAGTMAQAGFVNEANKEDVQKAIEQQLRSVPGLTDRPAAVAEKIVEQTSKAMSEQIRQLQSQGAGQQDIMMIMNGMLAENQARINQNANGLARLYEMVARTQRQANSQPRQGRIR